MIVIVLVIVLAVSKPPSDDSSSKLIGRPAPELTGRAVTVEDGRLGGGYHLPSKPGRWVAVNFFASWCVPCKTEAPDLRAWAQAHREAGDGSLVQVVFGDEPGSAARFLRHHGGAFWPVVDGRGGVALDWGVSAPPETYLVRPDGVVARKWIGPVTRGQLDAVMSGAGAS